MSRWRAEGCVAAVVILRQNPLPPTCPPTPKLKHGVDQICSQVTGCCPFVQASQPEEKYGVWSVKMKGNAMEWGTDLLRDGSLGPLPASILVYWNSSLHFGHGPVTEVIGSGSFDLDSFHSLVLARCCPLPSFWVLILMQQAFLSGQSSCAV